MKPKTEPTISTLYRRVRVPNGGDTSTPDIHLKGEWLREARFETGTRVTVNIAGDCIVLIPDSPQEQALREQLAQLKAALG